ncbi:acylphosphatase [bacterium]|nr:acylphosphatase [bacterium]
MEYKRMVVTLGGRVQGVGFRSFARYKAFMLGIKGYARNTWNGKVEVVAEGPLEKLDEFLKELKRGPTSARVREVDVRFEPPTYEFYDFSIY